MGGQFRYRQRVRYHECDPQGVVFNAHYLAYFDITLTELWREVGGYDAMISAGTDMVVAEATLRYLSPLRFDDEFDGVARIDHLGETSLVVAISLERDGEVCAEGENRYVFIRSGGGGKTAIPEQLRVEMSRFLPAR